MRKSEGFETSVCWPYAQSARRGIYDPDGMRAPVLLGLGMIAVAILLAIL